MKNIFKALSVCTILSGVVVNGSYGVDIKTRTSVDSNGNTHQVWGENAKKLFDDWDGKVATAARDDLWLAAELSQIVNELKRIGMEKASSSKHLDCLKSIINDSNLESEVSDSEEVVMKKMDEEEYSKRLDDIFEKLLEVEKNEKAREYMIKVLEMVETALYKKHEVYDVEQGEFVRMNEDEIDAFKINSAGELCRGCELCSEVELLTIENLVDNLVEKIKKEKGGEEKK